MHLGFDIKCWGANGVGQLGLGHTDSVGTTLGSMGNNLLPVDLGAGFHSMKITVGYLHACSVSTNYTLKVCGFYTF